jgi:hypothetical protein
MSNYRHGLAKSPEYRIWVGIKNRCSNPKVRCYPRYGGRGVRVCDRWDASFVAFLADMGQRPSPVHQLDRIDGTGNYEPDNCRWVTSKVNNRNRRDTLWVEIYGKRKSLAEWAEIGGVRLQTAWARFRLRGWTAKESVFGRP